MAALEGQRRACFLKWKQVVRVEAARALVDKSEEEHKVGRLARMLQSKLANVGNAFRLLVQCNREEAIQQKLMR